MIYRCPAHRTRRSKVADHGGGSPDIHRSAPESGAYLDLGTLQRDELPECPDWNMLQCQSMTALDDLRRQVENVNRRRIPLLQDAPMPWQGSSHRLDGSG